MFTQQLPLSFNNTSLFNLARGCRFLLIQIVSEMATAVPKALILGHSFIRRLKNDLNDTTQPRLQNNFHLDGTANVSLFGIGGRTVEKLCKFDLHVVQKCNPEVVILEIGTNDLARQSPEVVGSQIDVSRYSNPRLLGPRGRRLPRYSSRRFLPGRHYFCPKGQTTEYLFAHRA